MIIRGITLAAGLTGGMAHAEPTIILPTWVWFDNTGSESERVSELAISMERRVVYTIQLPPLQEGDLIDARATFEVTNPTDFNVLVGRQLIISDTPDGISGIELSEAAARNVTPDMHHDHIQDFGSMVWEGESGTFHLNLVAHAGASSEEAVGETVTVEPDYGRLAVTIIRGFVP